MPRRFHGAHHSSLPHSMDSSPDSDAPSTPPENHNSLEHLAGHVGHLSTAQQDALDTFRANLLKAGLYADASDKIPASHDDVTLLCVVNPAPPMILDSHHQFTGAFSGREASIPSPHRNSSAIQRRGGRRTTLIVCFPASARKSSRMQRGFIRGGLGGGTRCASTPPPLRPSGTSDVV